MSGKLHGLKVELDNAMSYWIILNKLDELMDKLNKLERCWISVLS